MYYTHTVSLGMNCIYNTAKIWLRQEYLSRTRQKYKTKNCIINLKVQYNGMTKRSEDIKVQIHLEVPTITK